MLVTKTSFPRPDIRAYRSSGVLRNSMHEDDHKEECRDLVLEHFIEHHSADTLRLLSLPSYWWQLEQGLHLKFPRQVYIGVERNTKVFDFAGYFIPGRLYERRWLQQYRFDCGKRLKVAMCDGNMLIHADLYDFFYIRRFAKLNAEERSWWSSELRQYSAVWLDFMSPLCRRTEFCISELVGALDPSLPTVPVAITVLKARELKSTQSRMAGLSRVEYIRRLLSRPNNFVEVVGTHEYCSLSHSSMLTVFAVINQ